MAEFDFPSFHEAVHRMGPLPWQARLAERVRTHGWSAAHGLLTVGVPTGLGKTTCLDIAVWALAADAAKAPAERHQRRRIWYVVNRRLLVDAAAQRAQKLADALARPSSDPTVWAADRLRSLGGRGQDPLHVASLRGGLPLGDRPPDPAQPSLILATPAMFGSRWLFGGYGVSRGMRPIDAALAGTDSLVLLDEAHLAAPLVAVHSMAMELTAPARPTLPTARDRIVLVALTATSASDGERFDLDDDDLAHPIVARRLGATKHTRLAPITNEKGVARALAAEVHTWLAGATPDQACLVFANRPAAARTVYDQLVGKALADITLLTGRMREPEAHAVRLRVLDPQAGCPAGVRRSGRSLPLVVVATQTLEVGADLDVDHLITESASARALVQRFGRLNRFGDGIGTAVVVHGGAAPLYEPEADAVWARLNQADADGPIDLSPASISAVLGTPADADVTVPELLPAHLWEWAKTTVPPLGAAPIAAFLDPEEGLSPIQVAWRAGLRDEVNTAGPDDTADGPRSRSRLWPPLSADELVDVALGEARPHFTDRSVELFVLGPDGATIERRPPGRNGRAVQLAPGEVVVLDSLDGGYDAYGWAATSTVAVHDVRMRTGSVLPLTRGLFEDLLAQGGLDPSAGAEVLENLDRAVGPDLDEDGNEIARDAAGMIAAIGLAELLTAATTDWLRSLSGRLPPKLKVERPADGPPLIRLAPQTGRQASAPVRVDAFDELSFDVVGASDLKSHLEEVGGAASEVAMAIGLASDLVAACGRAGRLHDIGKADARFQQWLAPQAAGEPVAKSSYHPIQREKYRILSGWPRGGRHELLSLRLSETWAASQVDDTVDVDLVLHLVASHHGWGRPSFEPLDDPTPPPRLKLAAEGVTMEASADLSMAETDQPARFHRLCARYGYWGLALLEAVVRQSDHAVSQVVVR